MRNFGLGWLTNPWLWLGILISYWVALFVGTHIPVERVPDAVGNADKVAHFLAFGLLALIMAATWQAFAGRLTARQLVWAWVIIAAYGAVEELTQPFVNRVASVWDWLSDIGGAAAGLAFFYWGPGRWLAALASERCDGRQPQGDPGDPS